MRQGGTATKQIRLKGMKSSQVIITEMFQWNIGLHFTVLTVPTIAQKCASLCFTMHRTAKQSTTVMNYMPTHSVTLERLQLTNIINTVCGEM